MWYYSEIKVIHWDVCCRVRVRIMNYLCIIAAILYQGYNLQITIINMVKSKVENKSYKYVKHVKIGSLAKWELWYLCVDS